MTSSVHRRIIPALLGFAGLGVLALGSSCTRFVESHCANGSGDQQCRDRGQGMFCSQCTLDNDGCVEQLPDDETCRVSMTGTSTGEGTSSSGGGSSSSSSTGSGSGSSDGDSGIPSCTDLGDHCLPVAPGDFRGPVAVLSEPADGGRGACSAPFEFPAFVGLTDVVAPDATCECECGLPMGAVCAGGAVERYSSAGCPGSPLETVSVEPGCNDLTGSWSVLSGSFYFQAPIVTGGSCEPLSSVVTEPAAFATRNVACAGAFVGTGCASGELCVPEPTGAFAPQWCVWQSGEHACPADGPYVDQVLLYQGLLDERGCEECTCAPPEGSCVGTTATLSVENDCMGAAAGTLSADACVNALGAGPAANAISHNPGGLPSGCAPNEPAPTGEVIPSMPITLCCTR